MKKIATVVAFFVLRGLLAQRRPVEHFPNVSVTEKNKTAAEMLATKEFISATTTLLKELHGHNITDKNKTITENFITVTETFL